MSSLKLGAAAAAGLAPSVGTAFAQDIGSPTSENLSSAYISPIWHTPGNEKTTHEK
jgi:hypothetical protein